MMLAVLRSVFTSETISSSPRATSIAFPVLPEPEQTSAAVAILSPFSSLARTSASEVLTVVSRLMASMGCLLSAPHMLAVRGKSSGMSAILWLILPELDHIRICSCSDLAAVDVALVVAVRQPCCDFPQVTGPDWRTALRTIGLWVRCPAVYPDEFDAPPF